MYEESFELTKHKEIYGDQSQRITSVPTTPRLKTQEKREKNRRGIGIMKIEKKFWNKKELKKEKTTERMAFNNRTQQIDNEEVE